jgi:mRNA interferase MazF
MASFEHFDVVVPFPFTDADITKRRPALALSGAAWVQQHVHGTFAMVTSARHSHWPSDVTIQEPEAAGLRAPSVVRWKLFTLPAVLVERRLGAMDAADRTNVLAALRELFGLGDR